MTNMSKTMKMERLVKTSGISKVAGQKLWTMTCFRSDKGVSFCKLKKMVLLITIFFNNLSVRVLTICAKECVNILARLDTRGSVKSFSWNHLSPYLSAAI
jgi:hypothetical protein